MILLAQYWRQIAGFALLGVIFLGGYYEGHEHEKRAFDAFKLQTEVVAKVAEQHTKQVVDNQQKITEDVTKGYSNAVTNINAYYAKHPAIKWMHDTKTSSSDLPTISSSTARIDEAAKVDSINTTGITLASPLDCASDVLQLLNLQKWIVEQNNNDK